MLLPPSSASQVLHYLNAMVSLQLQLLRDEAEEEALAAPNATTTACKDFTCPVQLAAATGGSGAGGSAAAVGAGPGTGGNAADGPSTLVDFDAWTDDPEAGVAVRRPDGRCGW